LKEPPVPIGQEVGENCIMRSFITCTLPKHNKNDQVKKDETEMHIGFWWESQKKRDHWEDQLVGRWTIL
jgi:hypothetical protein